MTQEFYTIVTDNGLDKQLQCLENSETFDIAYIAVGDGTGEPSETQTSLKNEKWRGEILSHGISDNKLFTNILIPIDAGNFTIREIGLFDSDNTLLCVGKCPAIEKHNSVSGGAQELFITVYMAITNGNLAPLIVQNSKEIATTEYVNENFANKDLNNLSEKGQEKFNKKQDVIIAGEGIIKKENTLSASLSYEYLDDQIIPININFAGNILGISYIEV